ncbi:unnamed protein product [Ixodes pacificus]
MELKEKGKQADADHVEMVAGFSPCTPGILVRPRS